MSHPPILPDLLNATSSPVSADGRSPCAAQDGPMIGPSGPDRPHASLSAQRGANSGVTTSATSHPTSQASPPLGDPPHSLVSKLPARQSSERLQLALESRLKAKLPLNGLGSMIYLSVWKPHTTPAGRQIFRLRGVRYSGCGRRHSAHPPTNILRGRPSTGRAWASHWSCKRPYRVGRRRWPGRPRRTGTTRRATRTAAGRLWSWRAGRQGRPATGRGRRVGLTRARRWTCPRRRT